MIEQLIKENTEQLKLLTEAIKGLSIQPSTVTTEVVTEEAPAKPKKKAAAKKKPEPTPETTPEEPDSNEADEVGITVEEVTALAQQAVKAHGRAVLQAALDEVGAARISQADQDQLVLLYKALTSALQA